MSGDAAAFGQAERRGVDFAINRKNATGGVLGQKIVAIYGDDAGKPEQAVSVANRLTTKDEVVILLGKHQQSCQLCGVASGRGSGDSSDRRGRNSSKNNYAGQSMDFSFCRARR